MWRSKELGYWAAALHGQASGRARTGVIVASDQQNNGVGCCGLTIDRDQPHRAWEFFLPTIEQTRSTMLTPAARLTIFTQLNQYHSFWKWIPQFSSTLTISKKYLCARPRWASTFRLPTGFVH